MIVNAKKDYRSSLKIYIWLLLAVLIIIVVAISTISTHRASDKALEASCWNNLKLIHSAINSYVIENNYNYPLTLEALVENNFLEEDILKCSLANVKGGLYFYKHKTLRQGSDYNYTIKYINKPRGILCWDKDNNHSKKNIQNMKNVLFKDGYIGSYPIETWRKQANDYMLHGD